MAKYAYQPENKADNTWYDLTFYTQTTTAGNKKFGYSETYKVQYYPGDGTLKSRYFQGNLFGNATTATSAGSATSATKSTKVALNNAASTSSYNLLLTNATTNTTEGSVYLSSTNIVKYNVSTGAIETKAYKVAGKATMQYNETDDCIEFVFA